MSLTARRCGNGLHASQPALRRPPELPPLLSWTGRRATQQPPLHRAGQGAGRAHPQSPPEAEAHDDAADVVVAAAAEGLVCQDLGCLLRVLHTPALSARPVRVPALPAHGVRRLPSPREPGTRARLDVLDEVDRVLVADDVPQAVGGHDERLVLRPQELLMQVWRGHNIPGHRHGSHTQAAQLWLVWQPASGPALQLWHPGPHWVMHSLLCCQPAGCKPCSTVQTSRGSPQAQQDLRPRLACGQWLLLRSRRPVHGAAGQDRARTF